MATPLRLAAAIAAVCGALVAQAQVEQLSKEELQSMRGNFGAVARGESTEREGVLKSEEGKYTVYGGMASSLPSAAKANGKAGVNKDAPPEGMAGAPDAGMGAAGGMSGGPPAGGKTYVTNNNPRDFSGPWNAMLITGTGELLDVPSGERPGPHVVSPYEATRLCSGQSGMMGAPFNARIRDEQITLLLTGTNYARVRRIFMNAEHPATVTPTFSGHSVGKWEGDTLVVDTVGIKGAIGRYRDPESLLFVHLIMGTPTLHVVERFTKTAPDKLEVISKYDDAATGLKPYTMKVNYKLGSLDPEIEEVCEAVGDLFGPGYTQGVLK